MIWVFNLLEFTSKMTEIIAGGDLKMQFEIDRNACLKTLRQPVTGELKAYPFRRTDMELQIFPKETGNTNKVAKPYWC